MLTLNKLSIKSPLVRTVAPIHKSSIFAAATPASQDSRATQSAISSLISRSEAFCTQRLSTKLYAKKGGKAETEEKKGSGDVDLAKIEKEAKADAEERMKKSLSSLGDSFNTIRTGRANPAILDKIMVEQFGSPMPLKSLAQISVPEASTLLISPFDRSALKEIEKALQESDIGINPSNDGEKIRLNIPMLTQDRRKELAKSVAKFAEDGKVALRNVRKDVMKKIDKVEFSKDAKKNLEDAIQKLTDQYVKKVDEAAKVKTDEVMKL
ncbi:hypothetical protein CEUSTIGMA_g10716.t1 [Chlamydomonas eustigma]|uniref:Ribosome-recycling factor, chloroplastic n=1 Tax=Chlamydomonas eustigma TaxID=1157962 RepID=A0A250XKF6_9CHLO|nr:hypothetical protein CEUSTIGMA_g10716.t1 [Chlamydomonas eustigma]|eukprot:GAX83290.1 hypothetical protein CEUSTIGMA_g10716.t1 [Chlamydomonas eustigma]